MVYSDKGLNGMSQAYHRLYRDRLMRGKWRNHARPILLNNWEATYFDFDEETIYKNRWIIQFVLIVVPFMGSLDASIVNVVLPSIKKDLGINLSLSSLIVSSYIITVATTIIIFGKLGDLKGKGRVFLYGIIVFIFGSFLCSISPNITILIIFTER